MTGTPETLPSPAVTSSLPATYRLWISGIVVSLLGNGALYFALGWTASAQSGKLAGLVLTAINVPRALLLLLGGAVGDRWGARRVLIIGDAVMLVVCVVFALALHLSGPAAWILLLTGLSVGVVDAFYLPASGSMPRQLVTEEQLPRALGLRQAGGQIVSLIGAPVGGLLVVAVGLAGVLLLDALTFPVMLVVLIMIKPLSAAPTVAGNLVRAAVDGLRLSAGHPVLRPMLLLTGAVAGFVLPVFSILVPLLSRDHGWNAGTAGLVVGAQALGTIAVTLLVARRGQLTRTGLAASTGVIVIALGILVLGLSSDTVLTVGGATLAGTGVGIFIAHVSPTILIATPRTHLSRVQALLTLVQTLMLLVTNNVVGSLADAAGPTAATLFCAVTLLLAALLSLGSGAFRRC